MKSTAEAEADLRAGLEQICIEAAENLRRYKEAVVCQQESL